MGFVHDKLATGRKIRILTVVDTLSRFSPVIDPRFSYCGGGVVEALDNVCKAIVYPETIRVGQNSEFISRGPRSAGVSERLDVGLLAAWQADRQRVHQSVQWSAKGGAPERTLLPFDG